MAKTSNSQRILFEIELFLSAGRYEDAKVLLNFVDHDATDRATRLYFLLIDATIDGPAGYQDEIDQLANLSNPNDIEKEIVSKIQLLASKPREEVRRSYQPHAPPRNQSSDRFSSPSTRTNQSQDDTEHRLRDESAPTGLKQVADVSSSKSDPIQSWQSTVDPPVHSLEKSAVDPEEMGYSETIRYLKNRLSEKDELLENHDTDLQAIRSKVDQLNAQFSELSSEKEKEVSLLRKDLAERSELLQVKNNEVNRLEEQLAGQVSALKNQLSKTQNRLQDRDAELRSTGSDVDRLTGQLTELAGAKDREVGLLREELAKRSDFLQAKDDAIKTLEAQFASHVRLLENQLGEKQRLLHNREADLEALTARSSELTRECADLKSEREMSVRLALEELSEKTTLFQTTATAIDELETQSSAVIASFERQLAEKQAIVEQRSTELFELRQQIVFLTERLADAEAAQRGNDTLPHDEFRQANPAISATPAPPDGAPAQLQPTAASNVAAWRFQDTIADWFSVMQRAWQSTWKPTTFPKTALPVVGAVLLIIPIFYVLSGQGRMVAKSDTTNATVRQTRESAASDYGMPPPENELKTPQSVIAGGQNVRKREARPARATTYVTRRAVPLREYPRYAAAAKTEIQSGARISVLEAQGSWFKVETQPPGAVGYVRKEYLVAQN